MSFNLLTQPWIPVLYANGRFDRVGICQALIEAERIRQIAASNPMDNVALLRFLLAVLHEGFDRGGGTTCHVRT